MYQYKVIMKNKEICIIDTTMKTNEFIKGLFGTRFDTLTISTWDASKESNCQSFILLSTEISHIEVM